jgi:arginyl-tRNA synthetase
MNISEEIKVLIKNSLKELGIEYDKEIVLEHPDELSHGDYSSNIALVISKQLKQKPIEVAGKIVEAIKTKLDNKSKISKVEVAGPGFINFYLTPDFFINSVKSLSEGISITPTKNKEKVMVEYTDANPLKEFHIGHLMSNTVGESIARLYESVGNEVKRACYQGDVGMHIAKAVWGAIKQKEKSGTIDWVKAYPEGAKAFNDDENSKKEIEEINKKIYDKNPELFHLYEEGKKQSLDKFEEIYKKLGTKFDYYFFESEVADTGKNLVQENLGKIFDKSEGAIVFPGEKYGLHTRVFINSQGLPTYEAKELGLAKIKTGKYDADKFVVVTGNEILEYFRVLKQVLSLIYPEIAEKIVHYPHGMLRLPSGKMSSRTGDVITAESLIKKIEEMVLDKIKDRDFSDTEKSNIAEKVAIGAIKYSILRSSAGSDIIFDFDKSISFEGDSGPYLQYSYARAMSVLRKVADLGIKYDLDLSNEANSKVLSDLELSNLEKHLYRFNEVVNRSVSELEPHFIATYLIQIAGEFNSYYGNNQIIDEKDSMKTAYRILLTKAVSNVLKKGMEILAMPVLEKM